MKHLLIPSLGLSFTLALCAGPSFAQQPRVFDWRPANDETVRLDPANYYTGETYRPAAIGSHNHVAIKAEKPVTIFVAPVDEWNAALQHPESLAQVPRICLREHVVDTTFVCDLPIESTILVLQDERYSPQPSVSAVLGSVLDGSAKTDRAVEAGIGAVFAGERAATRRFVAPNDVHIQYFRWDCVENCVQPEFQWTTQVKEKYQLSSFLKVYGGFVADHDGEQVSIKIKAPVPMLVAMLPSAVADQLHAKPDMLESALEKNACQQRGVQSLQFECKFDLSDGPQSLIVVPESTGDIPHKKAEIEMFAARCVANCNLLASKN